MKKIKRNTASFNLTFLDIMFCGFGAVVLLVLIINSHIVSDNKIRNDELTAEAELVEEKITAAKLYHRNIQERLEKKQLEIKTINEQLLEVSSETSRLNNKKNQDEKETSRLKEHINRLQSDIKLLDKKNSQKNNQYELYIKESGNKVRHYEGDGHRQYLTGLKLGGKRVLFLLDSSASMLDETIVNVIVKRNLPNSTKRTTRKWQQAIKSIQWMVANLPKNSQFTIVSFNESMQSLNMNQSFHWVKMTDNDQINKIFVNLQKLIPQNGTNLREAFSAIKKLSQKPDNIILITDGLPTQGEQKTLKRKVSPTERIKLFNKAIKTIPRNVPVNTILLPMEGDPMAASLFWKLAIDTKGSFMTPSRDWP